MRYYLFILTILSLLSVKKAIAQLPPPAEKFLGVAFQPGPNQELVTFGVVTVYDKKVIDVDIITEERFFGIASGKLKSDVNTEGHNMFKWPVFQEFTLSKKGTGAKVVKNINNKPTYNLWKIRYSENPYQMILKQYTAGSNDMKVNKGWASNRMNPSVVQMQILNDYGIKRLTDFSYGNRAFELIAATIDPMWISSYKAN